MDRKQEIRQEIDRLQDQLSRMEALPDGNNMPNGTVIFVETVRRNSQRSVYRVGQKIAGRWFFNRGGPSDVIWSKVCEWLVQDAFIVVRVEILGTVDVDTRPGWVSTPNQVIRDQDSPVSISLTEVLSDLRNRFIAGEAFQEGSGYE